VQDIAFVRVDTFAWGQRPAENGRGETVCGRAEEDVVAGREGTGGGVADGGVSWGLAKVGWPRWICAWTLQGAREMG
jgi:hypothetical protein